MNRPLLTLAHTSGDAHGGAFAPALALQLLKLSEFGARSHEQDALVWSRCPSNTVLGE